MDILTTSWPWYVAGPLIGLMVPLLLVMGNRQFGISGSIRDFVAVIFRQRKGYFAYDPEKGNWRLWFALGIVAAGLLLSYLPGPAKAGIGEAAQTTLAAQGIVDQ
ncbi:MAG TPA: YeeE/YedE family protein, partial [Bacteroidia bacterium]|nr:YeeE/YedE family protein [Bacteroidia bacterium]